MTATVTPYVRFPQRRHKKNRTSPIYCRSMWRKMKLLKYLTPLFLLAISYGTIAQKNSETDLIKKTFAEYKRSILAGEGEEAIKWVDSHTLNYYDQMLETAVTADSADVQKLGLMDKLTVLTARHRIPKEEALEMRGRDFFIYAIDKGMVGKSSVMNVEIGKVKVDGDSGSGQVIVNGREVPLFFDFSRENDLWKLDITSIFVATNAGLKQMLAENGTTDNEFILQALEMLSGKPVRDDIWQPLK